MVVADASGLIVLAKMGRLDLLRDVYGEVAVGPVVRSEALDRGKAIAARGVEQIEKAFDAGWLRSIRPTSAERRVVRKILEASRLDEGEAEAISLAHSRKLMLIVDDKEARAVAASYQVTYLGTAGVLLEAFLKRRLSFEELEETVRDLSSVMWLSPAVVSEILKRAREAKL